MSERERAKREQGFKGVRRCARLGGDLEELKLVGFDDKSRDLSVPESKKGSKDNVRTKQRRIAGANRRTGKAGGVEKERVTGISRGRKRRSQCYGLGRFPVTLYYEQWIRLLDVAGELREFLEANKSKLKLKTAE